MAKASRQTSTAASHKSTSVPVKTKRAPKPLSEWAVVALEREVKALTSRHQKQAALAQETQDKLKKTQDALEQKRCIDLAIGCTLGQEIAKAST
jgi:hypothetical protein